MPEGSGIGQRIGWFLFFASLVGLVFLGGAFVVLAEVFPFRYLEQAFVAGKALYDRHRRFDDRYRTDLWYPERTPARGVTVHDPARAHPGLTLYTSGHAQKAFLIDMDGTLVHEWELPFSAIWDESSPVRNPRPDEFIYFRKACLYPNGDLLAIYIGVGDSPWGLGLVRMDKAGTPLWKYLEERVHHDVDVGPDGRIYTLTHEVRFHEIDGVGHPRPPRIDDFLIVLSPDGERLAKVSLLDALVRSRYARLLNTIPWYMQSEALHTNTVEVIDRRKAALLPFAEEGQVMVSFRDMGVLAVVDPAREELVWALRGSWFGQHDPDVLPNGNILLFDNAGNFSDGGASRVIELDPVSQAVVWTYAGTPENRFHSILRSAQQRLPNGNTLITESDAGRAIEVTLAGDVVWEFVNPVRGGEAGDQIPVLSWVQRIDHRDLDPGFLGTGEGGAGTASAVPVNPCERWPDGREAPA